jgi:hypothetical protein
MNNLGSRAGLHTHGHESHSYCLKLDRWSALSLERVVSEGLDMQRLPLVVGADAAITAGNCRCARQCQRGWEALGSCRPDTRSKSRPGRPEPLRQRINESFAKRFTVERLFQLGIQPAFVDDKGVIT